MAYFGHFGYCGGYGALALTLWLRPPPVVRPAVKPLRAVAVSHAGEHTRDVDHLLTRAGGNR